MTTLNVNYDINIKCGMCDSPNVKITRIKRTEYKAKHYFLCSDCGATGSGEVIEAFAVETWSTPPEDVKL